MQKLIALLMLISLSETGQVPKILSISKAKVLKTSLGPHVTAFTAISEDPDFKGHKSTHRNAYVRIYTATQEVAPAPVPATVSLVPYVAKQEVEAISTPLLIASPVSNYLTAYPEIQEAVPVPAPEIAQFAPYTVIKEAIPVASPQLATSSVSEPAPRLHLQPQLLQTVIPLESPVTVPLKTQQQVNFDLLPQYNFAYQVHDNLSGNKHGHSEVRNGDLVQGHYNVLDPDGILRTVSYTSDSVRGFNAIVDRQQNLVKRASIKPIPVSSTPNFSYSFRAPSHSYRY